MSDCCHSQKPAISPENPSCHGESTADTCHSSSRKIDYFFWVTLLATALLYGSALLIDQQHLAHQAAGRASLDALAIHVQEMVNAIWWGIALGIVMMAIVGAIPREFVMSVLGTQKGVRGVFRATAAGVLLDLCSHGILMVGTRLYERGASIGQVMAFLIASPWNSFSLTLILLALIGVSWTLVFIGLSMLIAIFVGILFDELVDRGMLPGNPHRKDIPPEFRFWPEARRQWRATSLGPSQLTALLLQGLRDSRMVLRWVLFGVLVASLIRTFVSTENFSAYFGPSMLGLLLTMVAATIIEVCSEGSTPIAADLLTRARAPGNGFAFLMAGVATDYTEVMVMKDTTASWKIALFMPLLTLPQVFVVAWFLNQAV